MEGGEALLSQGIWEPQLILPINLPNLGTSGDQPNFALS